MTFSSVKAQEVYGRIRNSGKVNYWIGLAEKNYMTENGQGAPDTRWACDGSGLRDELKRQLAASVHNAEDKDWDTIEKWLFDMGALAIRK